MQAPKIRTLESSPECGLDIAEWRRALRQAYGIIDRKEAEIRFLKEQLDERDNKNIRNQNSQIKDIKISDLRMSMRLRNCLNRMGYTTLNQLTLVADQDLMRWRHFGPKCLNELAWIMRNHGLSFKMEMPKGQPPTSLGPLFLSERDTLLLLKWLEIRNLQKVSEVFDISSSRANQVFHNALRKLTKHYHTSPGVEVSPQQLTELLKIEKNKC